MCASQNSSGVKDSFERVMFCGSSRRRGVLPSCRWSREALGGRMHISVSRDSSSVYTYQMMKYDPLYLFFWIRIGHYNSKKLTAIQPWISF